MSRRRVSVRELGRADLQGWLQRQTPAGRSVGAGWRRSWFVLKDSALYWYPSHMAEEAEGFLDLTDFTIQPIRISGKQHVIKVSQRGVATVVMAAESFAEMSLWLDKLSAALLQTRARQRSARERYSQLSEPEGDESVFYSCQPYTELPTSEPVNGEYSPPCFTSSPFYNHVLATRRPRRTSSGTSSPASTSRTSRTSRTSSPASTSRTSRTSSPPSTSRTSRTSSPASTSRTSRTSSPASTSRTSRTSRTSSTSGTSSSESGEGGSDRRSGSWLDLPTPNTARSAAAPPHFLLSGGPEDGEEAGPRGPRAPPPYERPDGTGTSSSPIGRAKPSNQSGPRGSLVSPFSSMRRRESLRLVRHLNPHPKMEEEEADLLAMEAVLASPTRHALRFWNWQHKFILLQEITNHKGPAGGARGARIAAAKERNVAETSV